MFGWWKKNDGFEWHQYVRTTIALRREARRVKAEELKRQAADNLKAAGAAAGAAARDGARGLGAGSRMAVVGTASVFGRIVAFSRPLIARAVQACGRLAMQLWAWLKRQVPGKISHRIGAGAAISALVLASGYVIWSGRGASPALPGVKSVTGRASVVGPGVLRVGSAVVRLDAIEPPEREQVCTRGKQRWRCGDSAVAALSKLIAGKTITCQVGSVDAGGAYAGACFDKDADIAGLLVKGGHVFAASGLLARYRRDESAARDAKAGLWAGDVQRPSEWRAKVWDEAKKRTPDGCPIKGHVTGGAKVYVLPGAVDYERARVNPQRGGRWFCTEQEAIDAGWKPSVRG